jgi:hypothetical protein
VEQMLCQDFLSARTDEPKKEYDKGRSNQDAAGHLSVALTGSESKGNLARNSADTL